MMKGYRSFVSWERILILHLYHGKEYRYIICIMGKDIDTSFVSWERATIHHLYHGKGHLYLIIIIINRHLYKAPII